MPTLKVRVYTCKNGCSVVGTGYKYPCYKCGGEFVQDKAKS